MKTRLAAILSWTIILFVTFTNMLQPFDNVLDVFCWMGYLLVVSLIILWPKTGKDTRGERKAVLYGNWSERIKFEDVEDARKA